MKKLCHTIALVAGAIASVDAIAATYYSQGDLDPTLTSSWNTIRSGGGLAPGNFTSGDVFIIQDTHEMTTGAAWSVSGTNAKVWIENGGTLVASNTVTLAAATTFQIDDGGTYIHDNATAFGSSVFQGTESFSSNSTVELRNSNATGPSNIVFGNLIINLVNTANNVNLMGAIATINGDLSVLSTNGFEFRLSTNTSYTLTIAGDLVISGGTINTSNGATAGRTFTINVGGNYNQSGGTFTHSNSTAGCALSFNFTGGGRSFSRSAGTLTATHINWTITNGASITFHNDFTLATSRTFTMNSTSSMILAAGVTFSIAGSADLNGQSLTLRSTISGSARIAPVTGTLNNATNVTVERFIGSAVPKRAWRLLSSPVTGTTINAAWQEGVTAGNPNANYGTHITGGTAVNGFDAAGSPSIKTYNGTAWVSNVLASTNTGDITAHQGYMLFVRGDRSVNLAQGASATPTNTTLRATGTLRQGTLNNYVSVTANDYTLMGNPYPSAIDFEAIHNDHPALVNFYTWDPAQAGSYGLGGYNFVERTGAGTYNVTPHGGSAASNNNARYIPQGAAILLQGPGSIVNLSLNESYKTASSPSLNFFRTATADRNIAINLNNAAAQTLDGIRVRFDNAFSDNVTPEDARKLYHSNETMAIERNGHSLIVEKRNDIIDNDTIFLRLDGMKQANYQLKFFPGQFNGVTACLEDIYLDTLIPISLHSETNVNFTVDANPASAGTRFRVILNPASPLSLSFISFNGWGEKGNVHLQWEVTKQDEAEIYKIERSADGKEFFTVGIQALPAANQKVHKWIDANPGYSFHYYRIRCRRKDGREISSPIIRVIHCKGGEPDLVKVSSATGVTRVQFNCLPGGRYYARLLNMAGELIASKMLDHTGGNMALFINAPATKGIYILQLGNGSIRKTRKLIIQ